MLRGAGANLVAAMTVVVLTGCSGSAAPTAAPTPTASLRGTLPPCPTPQSVPPASWPESVPEDMPKPPAAVVTADSVTSDGVRIVKFVTPYSLRQAILFVVQEFPKAGFVLGRGDAEAVEADAPFIKGDVRGLVRMIDVGECKTQWLLATINTRQQQLGSTPLLPSNATGPPSPLPFG